MTLRDKLQNAALPRHIAIIMDGNGRWARQQGQLRTFGHQNGVSAVREAVEGAAELGVGFLTLYAFSTENWNRPQEEVNALMELLVSTINQELSTLLKNNIRLWSIGDLESLPQGCRAELEEAEKATAANTGTTLVLALSYSSRWEILNAARTLARDAKEGRVNPEQINEEVFNAYLSTKNIPDPELLIRTSGEFRISNFLLWQMAYTELYFTPKLWPDFTREDLFQAILSFQQRERRFGLTSEQLNNI